MGRPPSNGGPSFRFNQAEIAEMEAILQAHKTAMPERQVLVNLAEKFSKSEERSGKIEVQMKQVWNWFQNRRYAIRAKAAKTPGRLNMTPMGSDDSSVVKGVPHVTQPHVASSVNVRSLPQAPQHPTIPSAPVRTFPQAPQQPPVYSVQSAARVADNSQMEYEAKSARDGAWYDVSTFLSHRSLETGDPEVFVRFAGFGAEEDEWVNIRKNVRQRSLPCEASECVAVLPGDLILCFQEGKEQALYFDAHVLDAQRRRHDVRGCRCRFLVRYDHDQSEEIVALRKICRRPETDYRLQQLHAVNESVMANQNKNSASNSMHTVNTLRVYPPAEVQPKQHKVEPAVPPEAPQKRQRLDSTVPPEGSQTQIKVEPGLANVPQNQQTVQLAVLAPGHVKPSVLQSSDQASLDPEKVEPVVPTLSDEVPVELQKVQPLMSDPINEVSVKPRMVEADVPEAAGPVILPSTGAPYEGVPESAEPQKEPVVIRSLVELPAKLHDVQPDAPETKNEEPMFHVSVNEPNVVEEAIETKIEEPVVLVSNNDPNVVQEAKTVEHVVFVDTDVVQDAKTEETAELVGPDLVQEANIEEPVVPVDPDVVQEAKTKEPFIPVEPNVVQEAETKEPVVPFDRNVQHPNLTQEAKTEEPVDSNAAQEAKTKEHVALVDRNVAKEAGTEEPLVPVNDPMVIEGEIEQPKVSEILKINEEEHANVAENASDDKVENLDPTPENADVAMEEG